MKNTGKFIEQLLYLGKWIREKKKFLFLSPDYVVVGLSMKEYLKHFPSKDEVKKDYMLIGHGERRDGNYLGWFPITDKLVKEVKDMKNYISKKKKYTAERMLIDWLIKNPFLYNKAKKQFQEGFNQGIKLKQNK